MKKKIIIPTVLAGVLFIGVSFQNDFFALAKQIEIFTNMYKVVNQNYVDETNPASMMDVAIKSMLKELDPYTVYFDEQDVLKFKINNTGEYTGIGAMITRKDDKLILKEVYENMPADKAGFKAGDVITQIGDVVLKDFKEDASQLLKGAKNTKIDIVYFRQGVEKKGQIILNEVEIKAVPYFKLLDNKTGYIVLSKFNEKASAETKEALLTLKEQGATKIILDLRDNPGGLLHEAVNICNLFVPKDEIITTTKSKNKAHNLIYKTKNNPIDTEIPLAIIVNDRSASASEIVSGALQDLDRAVIVGNRSFGKGLVQRPFNLTYGTQVKVTISKYYTPSGRCIQATDYSKKDENGKAIKTSEKEFNAFKTKGGRTVYDGGGVLPDIEIAEMKSSNIGSSIASSEAVFEFANILYYKNPTAKTVSSISDAEFNDFKTYIKKEKVDLNTNTDKSLKNLLEAAKKDKIDSDLSAEIKQLELAIERSKDKELDKNKEEIKRLLLQELLLRYGYRNAFYNYVSTQYADVLKAQQILNSPTEYNKILKNKMKKFLFALVFLCTFLGFSQEETVHSIYFDTDVREIKQLQSDAVVQFLSLIDTTRLESVAIYGYCDDVGKVDYNYKLSQDRANSVKTMLVKKGVKYKIIVKIEGKGKVMIDEDLEPNVPEARSKNRRVDVVLNFKPLVIEELNIPGLYSTIRKNAQEGDRVYLDKLLFDAGSSKLKESAKKELDKITVLLKRYPKIHVEIQGHVCCTPTFHKEAIDKDTKKRELSKNRAERVYRYLQTRGISKTRLTFKGYGNTQPLGKDVQLDRRVELVITKI